MSEEKREVVDKEIQSMMQKGALREVQPVEWQYLSKIFVRPKREMNKFRPIINLKQLNTLIPYRHFKKGGMKDVIDLLNQGNYMINTFKGCLLAHSNSPLQSEVLKASVERETVRNASASIWGRTRPKNFQPKQSS